MCSSRFGVIIELALQSEQQKRSERQLNRVHNHARKMCI
jgi:hypothetical protein